MKTIKDVLLLTQRDAHTGITHADDHFIACSAAGNLYLAFSGRILDSIIQQILQYLFNAISIAHDSGQIWWDIKYNMDVGGRNELGPYDLYTMYHCLYKM